jgi:hypothetical protein
MAAASSRRVRGSSRSGRAHTRPHDSVRVRGEQTSGSSAASGSWVSARPARSTARAYARWHGVQNPAGDIAVAERNRPWSASSSASAPPIEFPATCGRSSLSWSRARCAGSTMTTVPTVRRFVSIPAGDGGGCAAAPATARTCRFEVLLQRRSAAVTIAPSDAARRAHGAGRC